MNGIIDSQFVYFVAVEENPTWLSDRLKPQTESGLK